jgi:histidine ammonia-lyase
MPPEEIQIIEDFLTFLENARTTLPATNSLWEHLPSFLSQIETVEDSPLVLALSIQSWCQEVEVNIDPKAMRQLRASMVQKGKVIPTPAEGEKASKVYNKALIAESVNNAIREKSA